MLVFGGSVIQPTGQPVSHTVECQSQTYGNKDADNQKEFEQKEFKYSSERVHVYKIYFISKFAI